MVGRHRGVANYTIGQREGLGIARGFPVYIIGIDHKKNQLIIGTRESALKSKLMISDLHFALKPLKKKVALRVKIRYNHKESEAEVFPQGRKLLINFKIPQFAITPGQSAVFYDRDKVLGGGIIEKVLG